LFRECPVLCRHPSCASKYVPQSVLSNSADTAQVTRAPTVTGMILNGQGADPIPSSSCIDSRDCARMSQSDADNDGQVDYSNHIDVTADGRVDVSCTLALMRQCPVLCRNPSCAGSMLTFACCIHLQVQLPPRHRPCALPPALSSTDKASCLCRLPTAWTRATV
jgi:hypothetical protein